ncbi:unnamed protein product, partial [Discosporangium mesarthrocarpum]
GRGGGDGAWSTLLKGKGRQWWGRRAPGRLALAFAAPGLFDSPPPRAPRVSRVAAAAGAAAALRMTPPPSMKATGAAAVPAETGQCQPKPWARRHLSVPAGGAVGQDQGQVPAVAGGMRASPEGFVMPSSTPGPRQHQRLCPGASLGVGGTMRPGMPLGAATAPTNTTSAQGGQGSVSDTGTVMSNQQRSGDGPGSSPGAA